MSQPTADGHENDDRRPTWTVQSVYDPDGGGKDFAYTVGLDDIGHPELHLWARPGLGDDPGDDWMFSPADRCHILNELAFQLVDGSITVGSEIVRHYDDGDATVRFTIGRPGDVHELEAFGVAPGALVLPVRWSLSRAPEGPAKALVGRALVRAKAARREILATVDRRRPAPPGWELDGPVTWRRTQRWGPLTPVVLARAAQLWQADANELSWLLSNAVDVREAGSLTWPISLALAAARPAGRREAMDRLPLDVVALVDHVADAPVSAARWSQLMQLVWGGPIDDPDDALRARRSMKGLLVDVTLACLAVEVVADVIDPQVLVHGRGPWDDALAPGDDTADGLRASPEVVDVVRRLLDPLTVPQLSSLATRHAVARDGDDDDGFGAVTMRLRGWALVGPAGCPWRPTIGSVRAWRERAGLVGAVLGTDPEPHQDLREWATVVASALTHRARLSADEVHTIARPFRDLVPHLETVLNEPILRLGDQAS
ncbi:hypothetical protein, partial [Nocardioides sp.]|uniref:hypothetical protein n=1 Tax=Nocardioides sp. TaxID=35761 RepID=UPI0027171823